MIDPRKLWREHVQQAQRNIDSGDPHQEDVLIIRMDAYVDWLQLQLAQNYARMDIAMTRGMTKEAMEKYNTELLAFEKLNEDKK